MHDLCSILLLQAICSIVCSIVLKSDPTTAPNSPHDAGLISVTCLMSVFSVNLHRVTPSAGGSHTLHFSELCYVSVSPSLEVPNICFNQTFCGAQQLAFFWVRLGLYICIV